MNLMALIGQHHLPAFQPFISIVIVQSSRTWPAATDGSVGLDPAAEILLFAIIFKETFELALSHARFDISHDVAVRFTSDLGCPSHNFHFFIVFINSTFRENVMHCGTLCFGTRGAVPLVLWDHCGKFRITIDTEVDKN